MSPVEPPGADQATTAPQDGWRPPEAAWAVTIPDDAWIDVSINVGAPEGTQLLTTLIVNGTYLHLEAIEVGRERRTDHTRWQGSPDEAADEALANWRIAAGAEGTILEETTIRGRRYVLFASPHED